MARPRIIVSGTCPQLEGLRWESDTRLRIGRLDNSLEIVLNDPSVSRRHAEIVRTGRGWVIRDLGSANGTLLNGSPIGVDEQRLNPDDVVQCGKLTWRIVTMVDESDFDLRLPPMPRLASPPEPLEDRPTGSSRQIRASGVFVRVEATTQRTWEQALEEAALNRDNQPKVGHQFLTLLRTGHHLGHIVCLDELLQSILDDAVKALNAQRGAIVLMDETTGQLELRAASVPKQFNHQGKQYSRTIAQRSFHKGESLLCQDVRSEADLIAVPSIAHGAMSSIICAVLRSPRARLGVLHLDRGPLQEPFTQDDLFLADAIAASVAVGIECAMLVEKERNMFVQTVAALAQAVELRDQYTANHTQRVTDYSLLLAEALEISAAERHQIQIGTLLHDIGKIGIKDAILSKPGKLTTEEFEVMKLHTVKGAAILETIPPLRPMAPIARHHHERWDGQGYPDGLAADGICRPARIVAVADAFDAMTSDRPYRRAMPVEKALGELRAHAGTHFDPACVEVFLRLQPRVEEILNKACPFNRLIELLAPHVRSA